MPACELCGKDFPSVAKLTQHRNRRRPCMAIIPSDDYLPEADRIKPHKCADCGRRFTSPSGLSTHSRRSCPAKKLAENPQPKAEQDEIATLRAQIADLEQRMHHAALVKPLPPVPQVPNLSIYNNVTINVFGTETWQHIDEQRIMTLLDHVIPADIQERGIQDEDASKLFTRTAMLIYSDERHPENLTAYIPRSQGAQDKVMVYRGDLRNWEVMPLADAVTPMTKNTLDLLERRQPWRSGKHDLRDYSQMVGQVFRREQRWLEGKELRAVLVRNGDLIATGGAAITSAEE